MFTGNIKTVPNNYYEKGKLFHGKKTMCGYICDHCGKKYERTWGRHHWDSQHRPPNQPTFCSNECVRKWRVGSNCGNWKNGEYVNNHGYVMLTVPRDTPGCYHDISKKDGFKMPKHRYVMQNHLGRPLTKDESVHHKNGDRKDNRIENLELKCRYHGSGNSHYTAEVNKLTLEVRYWQNMCKFLQAIMGHVE